MQPSVLREVATNIAGYFRDFLESDFKKIQAPSRRIVLQTDTGFRSGMRLKPYEAFNKDIWRLLQQPSGEAMEVRLTPRKYTRTLSPIVQKVITEQIAAITESQLAAARAELKTDIDDRYARALSDPEAWIEESLESLSAALSTHIVRPLIVRLDGPLQKQAYSIIDSLYAAETDLVTQLGAELATKLPEILAKHLATRQDDSVVETFEAFLTLTHTQETLERYFQGFVAADAFLEFQDLDTFTSVTESVALYLYLGSMRFRGINYPLFFLPIEVNKLENGAGYELTLINQLFANRAALDFVLQERAASQTRAWASVITDRIIYLQPEQSVFEVAQSLHTKVANALDFAGQAEFGAESAEASNPELTLSSTLHLCAFEKGAEALVNDYEELITLARESAENGAAGNAAMVGLFESMVKNILVDNPTSIRSAIDLEWDGLPLVDRLVFDSPIPLNEEQRKILLATRHPEGRIIVVEGPPGTGKSHTITAIAADCAFNQRSCLVLSDKAEALEVVHSKLSEAMNRVRHDRDFPNPLLRLGRQDANFKKLVGNQTFNQILAFSRAMNANAGQIEQERSDTTALLKQSIAGTIDILGEVDLSQVKALYQLEDQVRQLAPELIDYIEQLEPLESHQQINIEALNPVLEAASELTEYLRKFFERTSSHNVQALKTYATFDLTVESFAAQSQTALAAMQVFERLNADDIKTLNLSLLQYRQLRMPIFGYLFRGGAVRALEAQINALPAQKPLLLKNEADTLERVVASANSLKQQLEKQGLGDKLPEAYAQAIAQITLPDSNPPQLTLTALHTLSKHETLVTQALTLGPEGFVTVLHYLHIWLSLKSQFASAPEFDYVGSKNKLDRLNTSRMNAHVDSRLVHFMENHSADAKIMAKLISSRQKFPVQKFEAVRSSFPVIIAGIREFGEYMPLAPEIFDVVVIDEASQVSVAQALPAILRAKKVVVLGDSRQFANVKSSNASNATNEKYRSNLVNAFERSVTADAVLMQRLSMFDVKKSILEFCSLASSYTIMLRKHFRSYPELIGYSSKTFYDGQLQAIKIRALPIDEVIRFDLVDTQEGNHKVTRTTNAAEVQFIANKLVELLELPEPPTVGVITPFREQHTLLTKQLFTHERAQEFEDRLRLKVMTFDSCQGEERKIIFYSMVATPGNDALSYVFPASTEINDGMVEEKLKVQRLNVGFSRAQETIWFVHSMPISAYKGAIAHALNHYGQALRTRQSSVAQTDPSSPMETKVMTWLQATAFVQNQPDDVEIVPQFPIGDYLKQLDPTYTHPAYRADFLVTCRTPKGTVQIIVEYDGFEYHFKKGTDIHIGNHMRYMKDSDVERQLTLESYGYRFIRINRFNIGRDPVATLDARLANIVETATGEQHSEFVERLRKQAAGMVNKEMRQCTRCKSIKPLEGFFDQSLKNGAGGVGRVCMACKKK